MKKITCAQFDKLKEAYVDGALPPDVHAAVDQHIAGCTACVRRVAVARQLGSGIGTLMKSALRAPLVSPATMQAGYSQIVGQNHAAQPGAATRSYFAIGTVLALVATLAVVGALRLGISGPLRPEPTPTAAATIAVPTIGAFIPETGPTRVPTKLISSPDYEPPPPTDTVLPTRCPPGTICGTPTNTLDDTPTTGPTRERSATPTGNPEPTRCPPGVNCGTPTNVIERTRTPLPTRQPSPTNCANGGCFTPKPTGTRLATITRVATPTCDPIGCVSPTRVPSPTGCANGGCFTPPPSRTAQASPTGCPNGGCTTPPPTGTRPPTITREPVPTCDPANCATPTCPPGVSCGTPTHAPSPTGCPNGGCNTPRPTSTRQATGTRVATPTCDPVRNCDGTPSATAQATSTRVPTATCPPGVSCGTRTPQPSPTGCLNGGCITPTQTAVPSVTREATPTCSPAGCPSPTETPEATVTSEPTPTCDPVRNCGTPTPQPSPTNCLNGGCNTPGPTRTRIATPTCDPVNCGTPPPRTVEPTPSCPPGVSCGTPTNIAVTFTPEATITRVR